MKKYLYYYGFYARELFRSEVTRETEHNYWIKTKYGEDRISKSQMSTSEKWGGTRYQDETTALLEEYYKHRLNRRFLSQCKRLLSHANEVDSHIKELICNIVIDNKS